MLANYLPPEDVGHRPFSRRHAALIRLQDPSFDQLYADLPAYTARLHERYPPVCGNCQPAVDDALRKADHRAQAEALGSALSRGSTKRRHDGNGQPARPGWADIIVWRLRGVLWLVTTLQSLVLGAVGE